MASNVVAPSVPNQFKVKADNSQIKQDIAAFRLSLVRSVIVLDKGSE